MTLGNDIESESLDMPLSKTLKVEVEMAKRRLKIKHAAGQVVVVVVLMMVVILGIVALILDGGDIMVNRRTAQAAADAGAMAGAQRACAGFGDAATVADAYAVTNGATNTTIDVVGTSVTVTAEVENDSFFAGIFGAESLIASATASAGCYGVSGKSVVPLAWRCLPPDGMGPFNPDYGCKMQTLSWPDELKPLLDGQTVEISNFLGTHTANYYLNGTNIVDTLSSTIPPEQIYIVITEDKICFEDSGDPNDIICDIDGDGKKDIKMGGDRGWLYLTVDTSNISDWVDDGPHPHITLEPHIWLSGKSGVETDVYIKMVSSGFQGEVVLIPIYNVICEDSPLVDTSCVDAAHASPPWPVFSGVDDFSEMKNQAPYYHIVAFAPFYVSCVSKLGDCPGLQYAASMDPNLDDKTPVIEGFFISDFNVLPDLDQTCAFDIGNCTISLSN